jgi:hypothetical protein
LAALGAAAACGAAKHAASPPTAGGPAVASAAEPRASADRPAVIGGGELPAPQVERPGLGTAWGEPVAAPISYTPFARASAQPWAEVALHYNDAEGVGAHAAYLGAPLQPLEVPAGDGALSVALIDELGRALPGYLASGRALIVGNDGARYRIAIRNATPARFEVVTSVDGLDVIDGQPADPSRRGYLVAPHGSLVIDGFRTSSDAVAAFRFGRVADSYAAQTAGDRDVGVIGLAIFAERGAVWTRGEIGQRDAANPFPARGYAMPPR